ncbi:MAG: TetR/AcrR family transcriptional regulator [Pseudomonadota bacterium]
MIKLAKPAGRPRACDLEARNDNLIQTAAQLFLDLGYSKVSLELIARQAHVAVRTIYVKFGGKSGLFQAVLSAKRDRFITATQLEDDGRPLKEVVGEFAEHFLDLLSTPEALEVQRMVISEARSNPEVGISFFEAGPRQSRELLATFFSRPDIRAQLRDDLPFDQLPTHFLGIVMGDPFSRLLFNPAAMAREDVLRRMHERLELFYRSVLKKP